MNNQIIEQLEAILKMYKESTLDKCSEKELRQYYTLLLEHGAMNGLNENTYYKLLCYIEKLLVSKNQEKLTINKTTITSTNSTVVVGDSNVVANRTESKPNKAWHETSIFKIIVPVLTSLLVAYLVYRFRWK